MKNGHGAPTEALELTAEQARRFLVRRHFLAPPRALPARAESVLRGASASSARCSSIRSR